MSVCLSSGIFLVHEWEWDGLSIGKTQKRFLHHRNYSVTGRPLFIWVTRRSRNNKKGFLGSELLKYSSLMTMWWPKSQRRGAGFHLHRQRSLVYLICQQCVVYLPILYLSKIPSSASSEGHFPTSASLRVWCFCAAPWPFILQSQWVTWWSGMAINIQFRWHVHYWCVNTTSAQILAHQVDWKIVGTHRHRFPRKDRRTVEEVYAHPPRA